MKKLLLILFAAALAMPMSAQQRIGKIVKELESKGIGNETEPADEEGVYAFAELYIYQ